MLLAHYAAYRSLIIVRSAAFDPAHRRAAKLVDAAAVQTVEAAMTHRRAVALMVLATLLWSIAGVVTRHLESARSVEVTFWRSLFNAMAMTVALTWMRGPALWRELVRARWPVWVSGVCWAVMFTAFMVALTLTSVANVLVTVAIGPSITAIFARLFLDIDCRFAPGCRS
jgi:drug/metabolite transporter (DMT)-like permease